MNLNVAAGYAAAFLTILILAAIATAPLAPAVGGGW
jgi:hypothetical protein